MCLLTKADFVFKSLNLRPQTLISYNGVALLSWVNHLASPNGVAGIQNNGQGLDHSKVQKVHMWENHGLLLWQQVSR
jgi:hypothetical protein